MEHGKDIYCNACGNKLKPIPQAKVFQEHLSINKEWGYFSCKDFMVHSFIICEECYDQWTSTFIIPIEKTVQTEWACMLPEEIPQFNPKKPRE